MPSIWLLLINLTVPREEIEEFWRNPANQRTSAWTDHHDINEVMLATTLMPEGFLMLQPF